MKKSELRKIIREEIEKLDEAKSKYQIKIDKPNEITSSKVKKEIEKYAKEGIKSKDIGLTMNFTADNPDKILDKFKVLKNKLYLNLKN